MSYFDPGYFTKKKMVNRKVKRSIKNKLTAWKLGKEYYDGDRNDGYAGFGYDGRWLKLLPKIIKKYKLSNKSRILDLGCKKGFIMKDLKILLPECEVWGIEDHEYPIKNAEKEIKKKIILKNYYDIPFENNYFDFVIGFSSIYKYNLKDVVEIIKEIKRVSKKSFFTIASYSNDKEKKIFDEWTLLGTTILHKKDWVKLFQLIDYKGDYYFTTAESLNLI
jgi:ubiquinone/menaquinone biosynthesis C-methylase UbiE|tara:strand:- start:9142 stop:9801 length:660 start_codon:yes stop_codon:yes gene_type:complete